MKLGIVYTYISLLIFLLMTSCHRTEITYYPSGKIASKITYHSKMMDGNAYWYYENGTPSVEAVYKKGQLHGKMLRYYRNGKIETECFYQNDTLEGQFLSYNEQGVLGLQCAYEHGKKNGAYREYYDDGSNYIVGFYNQDQIDGHWTYYDYDGYEVAHADFKNGNGVLTSYKNGVLYTEVEYKNSIKDGNEIYYLPNGEIEKIQTYKNGQIIIANN